MSDKKKYPRAEALKVAKLMCVGLADLTERSWKKSVVEL